MTTDTLMLWLNTEENILTERLRPYQLDSRNRIFQAWLYGARSVMYQSPTGSGKTPTIASIIKMCHDAGFKTLTLAHRDELIDNIRGEYQDLFGVETAAIKAGLRRDYSIPHQVGSIATYINSLDFDPDLIITDEGHHCISQTYLRIYAAHPKARLLMVTATPYRLSGIGFGEICDDIIVGLPVAKLEQMGNLVPAKLWAMTIYNKEQISKVDIFQGDYSESQMSELLSDTDQIMSVVDTYIEKGEGKQMMLYATSVEHSKRLVEAFVWRGIKAEHVDGQTKNRKLIFERFVKKETQVLSNCEIATEGNNIPNIEIIGLARKTKSLSLYLQMVGRGSRPAPGKSEYYLFDYVDNYWEHGLPNREHDWKSHFVGMPKGEKKKKDDVIERQFELEAETGEVFVSSLSNLPSGFKGRILQEVDPMNTKHAEILRRQQEKLAEIERKKKAKQEEIERKIAAKQEEIERKKAAKLAEIQRKNEAKLAEIQKRKEAKLAEERRKQQAKQEKLQRALDLKNAEIQRKEQARQAEIQRKENILLLKMHKKEEWNRRTKINSLISHVQYEKRWERSQDNSDRSKKQSLESRQRWEQISDQLDKMKAAAGTNNYLLENAELNRLFNENSHLSRQEKMENAKIFQAQRIEVQFEISMRSTHNLGNALLRACQYSQEKGYPKPTFSFLEKMASPYFDENGFFTRTQFDEAMATLKLYDEVE